VTGFEPATSWSRTKRATKLRYTPKIDSKLLVGLAGFEPTTSSTPRKRATKLRYSPIVGLTDRSRTGDLKSHNLAL
jgi:hypothetical protein